MQRLKKKYASWDEGKQVMGIISEIINLEIVEIEEYLQCEDDRIKVSCHLKPEGNSFILVKSEDMNLLAKIEKIL